MQLENLCTQWDDVWWLSREHAMSLRRWPCQRWQRCQCIPMELSFEAQPWVGATLGVADISDFPPCRCTQSSNNFHFDPVDADLWKRI